jgi:hypothetical protein
MLPVYVAAPFHAASRAREVHQLLMAQECVPTSSWATAAGDGPVGPEILLDSEVKLLSARFQRNIDDLDNAYALLVLSDERDGGEMFAEVGRAIANGIPVLWTGPRRILSCFAVGRVRMFASLDDALAVLKRAAELTEYRVEARAILLPKGSRA